MAKPKSTPTTLKPPADGTFKVVSPFEPAGDQPAAIDQLVAGVEAGVAGQVVLGVTGSGKSVEGSTKVILSSNGRQYHTRIDSLDAKFNRNIPILDKDIAETVQVRSGLSTVTLDPRNGKAYLSDVREISRHRYDGELYTVKTKDGRSNVFTDSHNVYVLREGTFKLVRSEELLVGDCVPIPNQEWGTRVTNDMETIDLTEWVSGTKLRVKLPKGTAIHNTALSKEKIYRVNRYNETISLECYSALSSMAPIFGARVCGGQTRGSLAATLEVSKSLLRLIGWYIAEGSHTTGYIMISTADESVVREIREAAEALGLSFAKRPKPYDYQINGMAIAALMKSLGGKGSANKHLPPFWPQLHNRQLGWLISSIFAGDGCVEKNTITLCSISRELVSDIQVALSRFDIHARIRDKAVLYKGERRPSYILSISGKSNCLRFKEHIGFGLERKDALLNSLCNREVKENTNVDTIALPRDLTLRVMNELGILQRHIAKVAGATRPLVSMYLSGRRNPSREKFKKITNFLSQRANRGGLSEEAKTLAHLSNLANVAWSPISSIEKSKNSTVVYDLSVPNCETFLANGYFVHNTHTVARVIERLNRPTLVLAPNKTLTAQLYGEFKAFFPDNAVEMFVSYYDYYQPEAYIPASDTFIDKDAQINEQIEQMRLSATKSLLERRDVIVVASVSAIYGLGDPAEFFKMALHLRVGDKIGQRELLAKLAEIQYTRNDVALERGTFRVRGETVDAFPAEHDQMAVRIALFDGEIETLTLIDPLTGQTGKRLPGYALFPKSHYVTSRERTLAAMETIKAELSDRLEELRGQGKLLEAQRLEQRTRYDLEMIQEVGYCSGIENYSRHLTGLAPGQPPPTLFSYLPADALLVVDESHVSVGQLGGMSKADASRKQTLVDFGFRLPSARDNRPLRFEEWEARRPQTIYVSATPGKYELAEVGQADVVELVVRPTGLLDPEVEVRPVATQVDDLLSEINARVAMGDRTLVTTLTKKMAENLTEYLAEHGIKVRYLHSDVDTLERIEILRDLRLGMFDVLVGINLLREGLDLPEVSLVAILDADKEGFLRSGPSLIQTIGRAARNVRGKAILYADKITDSMKVAMEETARRREKQAAFNAEHGITPTTIQRAVADVLAGLRGEEGADGQGKKKGKSGARVGQDGGKSSWEGLSETQAQKELGRLEKQMREHARNLEFEAAAAVRDQVKGLRALLLELAGQ